MVVMPAVPAFAGDLNAKEALGTRAIMECKLYPETLLPSTDGNSFPKELGDDKLLHTSKRFRTLLTLHLL